MEFRQLKYFATVAETLHFGKAAERLHISQPPLSRQIKLLEEELGFLLLERTRRKVALTEEGKFVYQEAIKVLDHLRYIRETLGKISEGQTGRLRIGYIGSVMYSILPDILLQFSRQYPNVKTRLLEMTNEAQMEALIKEEIDIGFVRTPVFVEGIEMQKVFEETFSLVLPTSRRIGGKDFSGFQGKAGEFLKVLAGEPFLAFTGACSRSVTDSIMNICKRAGFMPRVVHETSQINSIMRLVESGLGYAIIPSKVKEGYRLDLDFIELDEFEEKAELAIAYHPGNTNAALQNFISATLRPVPPLPVSHIS